jgi:hypothetical protein
MASTNVLDLRLNRGEFAPNSAVLISSVIFMKATNHGTDVGLTRDVLLAGDHVVEIQPHTEAYPWRLLRLLQCTVLKPHRSEVCRNVEDI